MNEPTTATLTYGQSGIYDCIGQVRAWDFEAVVGASERSRFEFILAWRSQCCRK